jgi:hypothetical protein
MEHSTLNERGIYPTTSFEIVAQDGMSYAEIGFAHCDDKQFRFALSLHYSRGGFASPIFEDAPAFSTQSAARFAALASLIARWPKPFLSDPASVHDELRLMRDQIASQLSQPTLF